MRRFILCSLLLIVFLLLARGAGSARADWDTSAEFDSEESAALTLDTRARDSFFDHHIVPRSTRYRGSWSREADRDAPRLIDDRLRLRYRDRDYTQVWVIASFNDWEKEPMELYDGHWEIDLKLESGRHRYLFVVELEDGRERERTDRSHDRRRRDGDRGWVSELEITRRGDLRLDPTDRDRRRDRDRHDRFDDYDLDLVESMGLQYQRVDGLMLTFRPTFRSREPWSPALEGEIDYGFKSDRGGGQLTFVQPLEAEGRLRFVFSAYDRSRFTDRTGVGDVENSLATLVFREDSRDWYRREGLTLGLEFERDETVWARFEMRSDQYSSLDKVVRAGWGGRDDFLSNPEIDEGLMRTLYAQVRVGTTTDHLWLAWELSDDDLLSSEYDFQQVTAQLRSRMRLGRQQALDLRVRFGTNLQGELPRQKRYLLGGIGTVRGYGYQSLLRDEAGEFVSSDIYGGERMWLGNAEYSFGVEDDVTLALFFDTGMAYVDRDASTDFDDLRSSVGLGVHTGEDEEGTFRLDLIKALDESGSDLMLQGRLKRMF